MKASPAISEGAERCFWGLATLKVFLRYISYCPLSSTLPVRRLTCWQLEAMSNEAMVLGSVCFKVATNHRKCQCFHVFSAPTIFKSGAGRVRDAFNVDAKNFYIEHCLKAVLVHNSRSLP